MSSYSPATSSDSLAVGTTVVLARPGLLCNVQLNPGSAASSVNVYDNASTASGKVLWSCLGAANGSSVPSNFSVPVVCNNGIVVVVAGTAATALVSYTVE